VALFSFIVALVNMNLDSSLLNAWVVTFIITICLEMLIGEFIVVGVPYWKKMF